MPSKKITLTGEGALLALASVDMRQAVAAAKLLQKTADPNAARSLETALAVCYWRPFSENNRLGTLDKKWRPPDVQGRQIHKFLRDLRNTTYAHTDRKSGRGVSATRTLDSGGVLVGLGIAESWTPIPRKNLPAIIRTCEEQAARFLGAATDAALDAMK